MAKLTRVSDLLVTVRSRISGAIERLLEDKLSETISVLDFGAKGDWNATTQTGTNDTDAFKAALVNLSLRGGGSLYIPGGNYLIKEVEVPSNTLIYGDGAASSVWQVEEPWTGSCVTFGVGLTDINRPDWSTNTHDVTFSNIAFRRKNRDTYVSAGDPWQWRHLLQFNACTRFKVLDCFFEGFNGDGIYIAGGFGNNEGHNLDGEVRGCYFSGIDHQNRNAISIIDCEGLTITDNIFRNCTSTFQPAPIDIEPNPRTFYRIRDIRILNNRFVNCKGQAAGLSVVFPDVAYVSPPNNILFAHNDIDGGSTTTAATAVYLLWGGDAVGTRNCDIRVTDNKMTRCLRAFSVSGIRGLRNERNNISEMRGGDIYGFGAAGRKNINILIRENNYTNVGWEDGTGMGIYDIDGLIIDNNTFRDIGKGSEPRQGEVLVFKSGRTGQRIQVTYNTFINEGRTVTSAISVGGYSFDAAGNTFGGNVYRGGFTVRSMPAVYGNEGEAAFTPVVYGDTTEGVGTYTAQTGRYHIEGNVVHFRVACTLTAHTGSGPMNVTLPTKAAINGTIIPVTAYLTGNIPSVPGAQVARLDGGLKGSVSRARMYRSDASGNININSAGSSLVVEFAGTYPFQP